MKTMRYLLPTLLVFISLAAFSQLNPPSVTGPNLTNSPQPTWEWSSGGGDGVGFFRYGYTNGADWIEDNVNHVEFTPSVDLTHGNHTLYVQERDAENNWSASGSHVIVVDLVSPTVTITFLGGNFTNSSPFEVSIVFSEEVMGFTLDEITVTNGVSSNLQSSDNITFTIDITPNAEGEVTVRVAASVCTDLAGNNNEESNLLATTYYTATPPILTSVDIVSDNEYDIKLAIVGDEVKLTFLSERGLQNVIVTMATHEVTPTSSDDKSWEAAYTMLLSDTEGTIPFSISFEDKAGNVGDVVTHTNFGGTNVTFDSTPPSAPNVLGDTPTNNPRPTWSWSSGGGDGAGFFRYGYTNGADWIGEDVDHTEYTPTSDISAGSHTLFVQERDAAGNWSSSGSRTIVVDTEAPTVSISSNDGAFTNNSPFTITIVFSKQVTGFLASNISVTNGTASNLNSADNISFTADIVADAENEVTIQIAAGVCTDLAGNGNTISNELIVTYYEDTAPTLSSVSITSNNANSIWAKVGDLVTVTFSSARKLQNVTATIAGKTATVENTSANMKEWKAEYTMESDDIEGEISFLISFEDANELAGSASSTTDGTNVVFDKTPPTSPTFTGASTPSPTQNRRPIWVWESTDAADGSGNFRYKLGDNDFSSGETYTTSTSFQPTSDLLDGVHTLYIQERDQAGNWSASANLEIVVDNVTETPTLIQPAENTTIGVNVSVEFTLPEAAMAGTVKMIFVCTSNIIGDVQDRVVVFNSNFEGAGTHSTTLNAEDLEDNANVELVYTEPNSGYPPKLFYGESYDVIIEYQDVLGNPKATDSNTNFFYGNPTAEIIEIDPNPRNTHVGIVDLSFSRRVEYATVTWDDFILTRNGTNIDLTGLPAITYTNIDGLTAKDFHLDLESVTAIEGNYVLTLVATGSGIVDAQDNPLLDNASTSWICDTTPPTLTLNPSVSSPTNAASFTVTANISKPTETFDESIIEATNATLSSFEKNSPTSYTFTVTPGNEGLITVLVPANTFEDMVTNRNATDTQISIVYDGTPPKPVISSTIDSPTNQTVIPLKIDFDETVSGFTVDNISISGGTISDFATTNNKVFTFNLNVTNVGTYTVNIAEGVCKDMAGNDNLVADEFSIIFDNVAPILSTVSIESNHTNKQWVRPGKKVFLDFESNEPIKNVLVQIHGNSVQAVNTLDNVWRATYTFTHDDDPEGEVTFSIDFEDLAGNKVDEIVTNTNFGGLNVTFKKTPPTISDVSISSDNISDFYAKPDDNVGVKFTVDDGDVILNATIRGVTVPISDGPLTWIASRQMTSADPEGFITFNITATDLAGNVSEPATATHDDTWVIFDKTPPTIASVTVPSGVYKVGDIISLVIESDDDLYTAHSLEVNGVSINSSTLINNLNNTYTVKYAVTEGNIERDAVSVLPVNIVLKDIAGNHSEPFVNAAVQTGTLTIDTSIPQILSILSNAEEVGNLIIGETIVFSLTPVIPEVGLQVLPQEYNNKPLSWNPNIDGSNYTGTYEVEEGDADQLVPLQLGEVTLVDPAGNISTPVLYNDIQKSIYGNKPTLSIFGTTSQCFSNSLSIPVSFELGGYPPFTLTYQVGLSTVGPIEINDLNYSTTINDLAVGEYTVSLVSLTDNSGNSNNTATQEAIITVKSLPDINFVVTSSPFNKDEPPVNLSDFVNPTGGSFSGKGVGTDGYFYPQLITEAHFDEPITITYTFTDTEGNGCTNKATYDVVVSDRGASMSTVNSVYCNYHNPFTITGSNPIGAIGIFTVNSPTGWIADGNTLTITPDDLSPGDFTITYSYQDGDIVYQATRSFTLDAVNEDIDFGVLQPNYCKDSPAVTLSAINAYPAGGIHHYEGPTVGFTFVAGSSTATLIPESLEPELNYQVSYYYITPLGCSSDTIIRTTLINPLPELHFSLLDNYNFAQEPILLIGNEPEGTFSGTGVSNNMLYPNLITPGPNHTSTGTPFTIQYSYTNQNTQCSNSISKSSLVRHATETIDGLNYEYCYSDDEIEISCSPIGFPGLEGTFYSNRGGITATGFNQANYSIPNAGVGVDTVFFRYTIGDSYYEVFKRVLIDSIGPVRITGLEANYCNNASQIILVGDNGNHGQGIGNFSYNGTTEVFGNAGNLAYLSPIIETPGNYEVTYTYQSSISSCRSEITKPVVINPVPTVRFVVSQACSDLTSEPVEFINSTISDDEVVEWRWNFNSEGESFDFDPSFLFNSSGEKLISLRATTINGCASQRDSSILVGVVPKANFAWYNECLTQEETEFFSTSEETNIGNYKWIINNEVEFEGTEASSINYLFSNIGSHKVKLVLTSFDNCKDSITKQVFIHPLINVSELPNMIYYEDFEDGHGNWIARSIIDDGYYSWEYGSPTGTIIDHAASGENTWFTNITFSNQRVENSEVVSPCYDFRGLDKPMIKLNIWSSPDPGRDGAVMQYSLNQGTSWQNLGSINSGISWYNSSTIQSRPADQFIGWSGVQMESWESARLSLDFIKGEPNVRFRIAYAADGNAINEFNGFAFDDVWIGNRQQQVLLEYFTNTNITNSNIANQNIVNLENQNSDDIIPLHYHTSVPANDPVHTKFPAASTPREFFYGVSDLPFSLINGTSPLSFSNFSVNQNAVEVKSLDDPPFSIELNAYYGDKVDIEVFFTSNSNLTNKEIVLQCALVQPTVNITESLASGETVFYNVVREFLPNSGGTSLNRTWSANESRTLNLSWEPPSEQVLNKTNVVVFIQNIDDKTVYQSASVGLWTLTSNPSNVLAKDVLLYPNPATEHLVIDSPKLIKTISIVDVMGRVIWNGKFNEKTVVIPVAWLKNGVYLVNIGYDDQKVIRRFVKQ